MATMPKPMDVRTVSHNALVTETVYAAEWAECATSVKMDVAWRDRLAECCAELKRRLRQVPEPNSKGE